MLFFDGDVSYPLKVYMTRARDSIPILVFEEDQEQKLRDDNLNESHQTNAECKSNGSSHFFTALTRKKKKTKKKYWRRARATVRWRIYQQISDAIQAKLMSFSMSSVRIHHLFNIFLLFHFSAHLFNLKQNEAKMWDRLCVYKCGMYKWFLFFIQI